MWDLDNRARGSSSESANAVQHTFVSFPQSVTLPSALSETVYYARFYDNKREKNNKLFRRQAAKCSGPSTSSQ